MAIPKLVKPVTYTSHKVPGLIIQSDLKGSEHITSVVAKASKPLHTCILQVLLCGGVLPTDLLPIYVAPDTFYFRILLCGMALCLNQLSIKSTRKSKKNMSCILSTLGIHIQYCLNPCVHRPWVSWGERKSSAHVLPILIGTNEAHDEIRTKPIKGSTRSSMAASLCS